VEASAQAEIHTYATEAGDVYLLCSDGLSDMVDDEHIEAMLNDYGHQLPLCVDQLIASANQNGGRDNVTAILVKVLGYTPVSRNPVARFLKWLK
jgi:protein phosphatase